MTYSMLALRSLTEKYLTDGCHVIAPLARDNSQEPFEQWVHFNVFSARLLESVLTKGWRYLVAARCFGGGGYNFLTRSI